MLVWPRLSAAERDRGAVEPVLNNDWMADRLHELLQHAEQEGEILLSCPFHLVGMGNGACIAAGSYIRHSLYFNMHLKYFVSIFDSVCPALWIQQDVCKQSEVISVYQWVSLP